MPPEKMATSTYVDASKVPIVSVLVRAKANLAEKSCLSRVLTPKIGSSSQNSQTKGLFWMVSKNIIEINLTRNVLRFLDGHHDHL